MLVYHRLSSFSLDFPDNSQVQYLFILLGGERDWESKVSCTRTQHNDSKLGLQTLLLNLESSILTVQFTTSNHHTVLTQ